MTKIQYFRTRRIGASVLAATLLVVSLSACKGRTMENMEPTGDTVEVVVNNPASEQAIDAESGATQQQNDSI